MIVASEQVPRTRKKLVKTLKLLVDYSALHFLLMSVLLETSLGDIVIDLEVDACPRTCQNFLKLCKVYYYNLNAFFNGG